MKLLLDTHVLIWCGYAQTKLPRRVATLLADPEQTVLVSSASAWEISTKHRLGKLPGIDEMAAALEQAIKRLGFEELPITVAHAQHAGAWTVGHRDPFDRILAAQAKVEGIPLVTADSAFSAFSIETLW